MKVQFLVEENAYYNSDMPYKIVESYYPDDPRCKGYDIYEVETDDIRNIRVVNLTSHTEYEADEVLDFKDGDETKYYVALWNPVS